MGETGGLRGELGAVTEWGGRVEERQRVISEHDARTHTEIEILLLVVNFL